jgi:hypothetical protein
MAAKKKKKKSVPTQKPKAPPRMIIRRNAAPRHIEPPRPRAEPKDEEQPLFCVTRSQAVLGASMTAGATLLGVVAAGKGWLDPKTAGGLLLGTGIAAAAAGLVWEVKPMTAAGGALMTAGGLSLVNQLGVYGFEKYEERLEAKREQKAEEDRTKRLADARAMIEAEAKAKQQNMRNGRRIVVVDAEGEVIEHEEQAAA